MPTEDSNATPPPFGDEAKAEKYITQITQLIQAEKLEVFHTDLNKFDPSTLQDHYRMDLKDYQIEISHSKQPNSGKDSFVILFTNLKQVKEGCTEKIILAYMHLSDAQFHHFKSGADHQIEKRKKAEEEKRFQEAMSPIDQALNEMIVENPTEKTQPSQPNTYSGYASQTQYTTQDAIKNPNSANKTQTYYSDFTKDSYVDNNVATPNNTDDAVIKNMIDTSY